MKTLILLKNKLKFFVFRLYSFLFYCFKIKENRIVFNNFDGKAYGDNPKYIAEELIKYGKELDLVWLVLTKKMYVPSSLRKVNFRSPLAAYMLSTAKIIINDVKCPLPFKKKKGQLYIQTWHGSVGLKYIEGDAEDKLDKEYIEHSKKESSLIDLMISGSRLQTEEYRRAFWYKGDILECGLPRNDILFVSEKAEEIKKRLRIPDETRVALYAPTFRDDKSTDGFSISFDTVLDTLEKKTNTKWMFLVKFHPNEMHNILQNESEKVVNVSLYPDIQELLLISDILLTDYSSSMLDYMIMKKPIFLIGLDIEKYQNSRGLKPLYFELPFSRSKTNEELIRHISTFDEDQYKNKLESFMAVYSSYDDGMASASVAYKIFDYLDNNQLK